MSTINLTQTQLDSIRGNIAETDTVLEPSRHGFYGLLVLIENPDGGRKHLNRSATESLSHLAQELGMQFMLSEIFGDDFINALFVPGV